MAERSNTEWLADLKGPNQESAITDLRKILSRGLTFALSSRIDGELESSVDDFVQDSLLRILDKIDTFRGESKFTTWAQKIAVRVAYTEMRRQRWKDISLEDLMPDESADFTPSVLADPSPDPEKRTNQTIYAEMIQEIIDEELTDRQRDAMMAIMVGGMPLEEVARRMGSNRNALYKLIHDARKRMLKRIKERGITPGDILVAFEG